MSSFLCFICHSTVNADTNEDMREKYREVVGMNLCPDSHLCHICCHVLNRLWLFKSVCLKRSLEYPVLFSEKGTLNLQRNDLEILTICLEETCDHYKSRNLNSKFYQFKHFNDDVNDNEKYDIPNDYVQLQDDRNDFDDFLTEIPEFKIKSETPKVDKEFGADVVKNTCINEDSTESHSVKEFEDNDNDNEIDYISVNDTKIDTVSDNEITDIVEKISNRSHKKKYKKIKKKFDRIILNLEEQKAELERRRKEKKYIEAEFKCYNCALGFLFKDTYQAHMMRHEESNGSCVCEVCFIRFATPRVLRAHRSLHSERLNCRRCSTQLELKSNGSCVCEVCFIRFATPRVLRAHRSLHMERLICRNCHAELKNSQRRAHIIKCWGVEAEVSCHLCGRVFRDRNGLQQHIKRFHRPENSGRSYACSVCGKIFNNQGAVRTHMLTHVQKKFTCDECPSTFSSPYTLKQHKEKHSSVQTQERHACECGAEYTSRKSLLAHKRNSLNHQETTFSCPVCNKTCPNQRSLSSHMEAVHSGTKQYACTHCPNRYSTRKALVKHAASHGPKIVKKLAICHLCGASFKENNKLNRHLKEVCEKAKLEEELSSYYAQDPGVI